MWESVEPIEEKNKIKYGTLHASEKNARATKEEEERESEGGGTYPTRSPTLSRWGGAR